jgi:cell division protein DivIC
MMITVKGSKRFPQITAVRVIVAVTAVMALYFVAGGALNSIRSHQLEQEESRLKADIRDLEGRYERLTALKEYLNSDEYIESVAREQLGLVRKGETGFVAISTVPSPTPAPDEEQPSLWWDVLIR